LWHRKIKADVISAAIENGSDAASGVANGVRNALRPLLRVDKKTGKPVYNWTADERKAIKQVVDGTGKINFLRLLGTFGYSTDQARNFLGLLSGGGIGLAAGGGLTLGGAAAAGTIIGAGTVARVAERRGTLKAAEMAERLALSGGKMPDKIISARTRAFADLMFGPAGRAVALDSEEE
jgi:hypothetical protein